ncbi:MULTISPECIES: hypothetical protein [unclassified Acinetobacter]|uniref:hypothetical protein n=1 Tax=unclassified Acinetobacter TaxID=196816 RepID=UPI000EFA1A00|nr:MULTISPECIES: hypothetical protein [unclassified Acinetobacter]MCH7336476.1 hypothetical protein [Acinetobacter sp. NIPH 2699]RLZ06900.1 hypothetical protein EAH57_14365 [Acinetobacter sp. 2JN-4]
MPNQTVTTQNKVFQVLTELDKPVKDYFFCLKEIQALHNAVIHFIGNESNPRFKKDIQTVHSALYGSLRIISLWNVQLDELADAISDIEETDDPTALIQAIYNDFQKLDADVQHLINLAKIACDKALQINPVAFKITGISLSTIQLMISAIQRMTIQLQSDIFAECDVLGELYPTIFKVEV